MTLAVLDLARRANKAALLVSAGSSDFTGKSCTPITVHWSWDTYMAVNATVRPLTAKGLKNWCYIIPDANFGRALAADAKKILPSAGGTFLGETAVPTGTVDFSYHTVPYSMMVKWIVAHFGLEGIGNLAEQRQQRAWHRGNPSGWLLAIDSDKTRRGKRPGRSCSNNLDHIGVSGAQPWS